MDSLLVGTDGRSSGQREISQGLNLVGLHYPWRKMDSPWAKTGVVCLS